MYYKAVKIKVTKVVKTITGFNAGFFNGFFKIDYEIIVPD